jgi:DNA-binding beta-propeller fold protein YncE
VPFETRPPAGARPADRFNTPVGVCQGPDDTVWVADAGNGRLLALAPGLEQVRGSVDALELPFRLAHHPTDRRLYVTDVGERTVRALDYEFGAGGDGGDGLRSEPGPTFAPDRGPFVPNGVAVHRYRDGLRVFVADEFYHTGDDLRGRVLVFDAGGTQRHAFREVREAGDATPIFWPQGLATDADGRLYVADSGYGLLHQEYGIPAYNATVVRSDRTGGEVSFPGLADPVLEDLVLPRDVTVLNGEDPTILVPDAGTGHLAAYGASGLRQWTAPAAAPRRVTEACARTGPEPALADADVGGWRLRGPVGIAPYTVPDHRASGVLVTEALGQAVGAYTVPDDGPPLGRRAERARPRDAPDQLSFPTAAAPTDDGAWLVADAGNGRCQRLGPDGDLSPVAVPETRFPFGLATWEGPAGRRVAVTDFTVQHADTDRPQLRVYADAGDRLDPLASAGPWGFGAEAFRLPRGLAVEPRDDGVRLYVADAGNGRVSSFTYTEADGLTHHERLAGFGFADGMVWNPADVAVGEHGVYVADANNHRIQRYDGTEWTAFGRAGYGAADGRFLLPVGVAAADGHLVVTDLVNRRIEVLAERGPDAGGPAPLAAVGGLGGEVAKGELWMPYMPGARGTENGVDIAVPDGSLNVCQRYAWATRRR